VSGAAGFRPRHTRLRRGKLLRAQTQWAEEMIEECATFPNAAHDDGGCVESGGESVSDFVKWDRRVLPRRGGERRTCAAVVSYRLKLPDRLGHWS